MKGLRLALRTTFRTPFLTRVAVISLALGIGANSAIYSLFDQMLVRALPVPEPDRLVNLANPGPKPGSQSCNQSGGCDEVFSYHMFRDLERELDGVVSIAAQVLFSANLAHENQTVNGSAVMVSGSYFPVLGMQPALGRLIGPDDDRTIGEHYVAVLSHGYWERQLGADPGVLNSTLVVNGIPMTLVGVAARGFGGTTLGEQPDVFVPITMRATLLPWFDAFDNRRSYWAYLFARLGAGVSIEQAGAAVNTVYRSILEEVETPLQESMSDQTMALFRAKEITLEAGGRGQSSLHGEIRTPLVLLFAITGIVLLIACANIANLLLARGARRGQEMAIRGALGASRLQLLTQLMAESCVLAVLGGVASLLVANATLGVIGSMLPAEMTGMIELELRPQVLMFAAALAIGTGVLFGMYPALHNTRMDLASTLKANAGQPSGARSAARFRTALVTAQIALSMTLLVGAGLFVKSLMNVSREDLGLQSDNVITFAISPQLNGYEDERSQVLFERVTEELDAIPGVSGVSAALVPILSGDSWGNDVLVEGFESGPDVDDNSRMNEIGPGYFSTLGVPLLAGREFAQADAEGTVPVAIVNEAFTRKFGLDGRNAVGKRMGTSARGNDADELDTEIVGVVRDAKYSEVKDAVPPLFFRPYRQDTGVSVGALYFYVRTEVAPEQVLRAIPPLINRLDPNLPIEDLKTLEQQVRENVVLDRLISMLSTAFAVLATLLAAIGLYGVLAYSVTQRTREIGLRMALGAEGYRVRGLVLAQVVRMTVVGGIIGLSAALFLGQAAESLLFGLSGYDPFVLVFVALALGMVAFGAGYLPALRASKVDPMEALRYE